jgi:hypothetical protein
LATQWTGLRVPTQWIADCSRILTHLNILAATTSNQRKQLW